MKRRISGPALGGLLLLLAWTSGRTMAQAPEIDQGSTLKTTEIKAEPFSDSKTVGALAKGTAITILRREGGWLRIRSGKKSGWVRMLSVRRAKPAKIRYSVEGILSLASGRTGTGTVVATTGIRGLTEEALRAAHFDLDQMALLESYRVSAFQARRFAAEGGLKAVTLEYLPGEKSP